MGYPHDGNLLDSDPGFTLRPRVQTGWGIIGSLGVFPNVNGEQKNMGDFFPPIDIPNPPLRSVFFAKNHRFIVDSSMKTARVGDFLPLKLQSSIGFGYFPSATKQMTENMMDFQATQWCCWHKDIVKPIIKAQVLMANTKPCLVVLGMVDV